MGTQHKYTGSTDVEGTAQIGKSEVVLKVFLLVDGETERWGKQTCPNFRRKAGARNSSLKSHQELLCG